MRYYIFKVTDSTNDTYYILNNQYIGYIGFDSEIVRSTLEWGAKVKRNYQLYATSAETNDQSLHDLNCDSHRFNELEIKDLIKLHNIFALSSDPTVYKIYHPNKNSSECYLKEIDGNKTIKDLR